MRIVKLTLLFLLAWWIYCLPCHAGQIDPNRLVNAIGRAENSVKYPYGIKSIDTHGDKAMARRICLNTVRNNYKRWIKAGQPKPFIEWLGDRYCPANADPSGHKVWARNVKKLYKLENANNK